MPRSAGLCTAVAVSTSSITSSADWCSHGSRKPSAVASSPITSQLLLHSPSGAIAGALYVSRVVPYALCRSVCSSCDVAGSTMSA